MAANTLPSIIFLNKLLSYDPDTGEFRWRVGRGRNAPTGSLAGCITPKGYLRIKVAGKSYMAHRVAWMISTGSEPLNEIDHINGNKSDNRLVNLRNATPEQNKHNTPAPRRNKSGTKGASWDKAANKWRAQIHMNGKVKNLGRFADIDDAIAAYRAAAQIYHGAFSNF